MVQHLDPPVPELSIWQQLRQQRMTCAQALEALIDPQGKVQIDRLDWELNQRFWRNFGEKDQLPPVIPLILWQNCYYLGSPIELSVVQIQQLSDRLKTEVKQVAIAEKSYRSWFRLQSLEGDRISSVTLNPLTGEIDHDEDITELAELHLSQADNQIERIRALIASALRNRASDIHLAPALDGLRIRFRIDGILRHITTLPPGMSRKVIVSLKVMSDMDIAESRRPQDGRISEKYFEDDQEQSLDLRVSTLPCMSGQRREPGEKAVVRLLRQQSTFNTIEELGFSARTRKIYEGWLKEPQGMIIFTGPTGSGKTSTLYTSLQAIAAESVNIVTVEDPVEYVLPGITQTQVHEAAGMTFAAGLRAILRQDPDIIMVGEIRDHETAETAVRAALTGHLVLTTLHTNDAIGAIPRLKDIGPDPGLISDALLGIVAQRLVRRVCPYCAEPYQPTSLDLQILGLTDAEADLDSWRQGRGCSSCFNSGYLGREAVIELLNIDNRVRSLIYEGSVSDLRQYLDQIQFDSFRVAAIEKVKQGVTTVAEIQRVLPHRTLSCPG
ncbi:MAG: GspE/PulE family protein [Oculatellaceae cyanobacterium Prado106]|jgi:type II secretory ATPase GspE/PulE/Tfp pilus assembly ATPase PilB-like protein|nr:GspE/PulE family protein [Oculatellaceae cyanobacterium Prado106]